MVKGGAKLATAIVAAGVGGTVLAGGGARAYEFEWGEFSGSIVTSLSAAAAIRVEDRDPRNVAVENGGHFASPNNDDGNLNFDRGDPVYAIGRITSDLRVNWRNFTAKIGGTAFYDYVADHNDLSENGSPTRQVNGRYSEAARDYAAQDIQLREAYVTGDFNLFGHAFGVTVGNQILNWGEALLSPYGIAVVNPLDVQKIFVPGAELKDGLIPVPMIFATFEVANGLSLEGFYTLGFEAYRFGPCGSFLSVSDVFCEGTEGVGIGGDYSDSANFHTATDDPNDNTRTIHGTSTPLVEREPDGVGDFGVALRYYADWLNATEFGLYFARFTSRLPALRAAVTQDVAPGTGELLIPGLEDLLFGGRFGTFPRSTVLKNLQPALAEIVYPEDIKMLALSFNTTGPWTGLAYNGEISYKWDQPLFLSEPLLAFTGFDYAGGVPVYNEQSLGISPMVDTQIPFDDTYRNLPAYLESWRLHDVVNLTVRATQIFARTDFVTRMLGANSVIAAIEGVVIHTDIPPASEVPYGAYGQNGVSGMSTREIGIQPAGVGPKIVLMPKTAAEDLGLPVGPTRRAPTQWSGGFTAVAFVEYPGIFDSAINLNLIAGLRVGLFGSTPAPLIGFQKDVDAISITLKFDYLAKHSLAVSYFESWGGGSNNPGGTRNAFLDKSFVGVSYAYTF